MPALSDLTGKTYLITGATNGIGKETARRLAQLGACVLIVGRNPDKTQAVVQDLQQNAPGKIIPLLADLSLMQQVRALAAQVITRFDRLDGLLLNAGDTFARRAVTSEGIETTFALNHLGVMLLACQLRPLLERSAPARVVVMTSAMHHFIQRIPWDNLEGQRRYSGIAQAYNLSKLGNVLFMRAFARRLADTGVTVNALHPGLIRTGFARRGGDPTAWWLTVAEALLGMTPPQAARSPLHLLTASTLKDVTGTYFEYIQPATPNSLVDDLETQERWWSLSEARLAAVSGSEQISDGLAEKQVGDHADDQSDQRIADQ
jgi:NAD(P)-dependent dehydrogenase (short-subunit alcohol dehydrogenase family)